MSEKVKILDIPSIKIVSINQKYILAKGSRRLILNPTFRDFKMQLCHYAERYLALAELDPWPITKVHIELKTYVDIDACIKVVLDGVCLAMECNDRDILELRVTKEKLKRGQPSSIRVYVE